MTSAVDGGPTAQFEVDAVDVAPLDVAPVDVVAGDLVSADVVAVDVSTFDAYVRSSGPRLKRLAFLLTGDHEAAEDLLQSAYAKVLPKWSVVSGYADVDAYLRRVMVNTRTSWWRRLRDREVVTAQVPERLPRTWRDLADDLGAQAEVLEALRRLPGRQRTAVVLRHYCDLSEAEVASVMGCSVGTVKSNTSRGLAGLRLLLAVADDHYVSGPCRGQDDGVQIEAGSAEMNEDRGEVR